MINKTRNTGKSVILTSHSMEECEALCTRLAIMVAGEFKCLGSVQHLKNKFAKGFVLTIKISHDTNEVFEEVSKAVTNEFSTALLKEKYMELLTFHISSTNLKWSQIFEKMDSMKNQKPIKDFTVAQMSLEQVFLHFSENPENRYGTFSS
jgi:ATP-binding cassette, subfamily A (ABC1), member 3